MSEWQPITNTSKLIVSLLLFAEDFRDDDFNPTGVVDGFWSDDLGWVIWKWNNCQDCYDTVPYAEPTHFALKKGPSDE